MDELIVVGSFYLGSKNIAIRATDHSSGSGNPMLAKLLVAGSADILRAMIFNGA